MRQLVDDAIMVTPSGETRNLLTDINIKLMRDADRLMETSILTLADVTKIENGDLTLDDIIRLENDPATHDVGYYLRVQMFSMNPRRRHPMVEAAIVAAKRER